MVIPVTALTYNGYVSAIANLAVEDVSLVAGVMTGNAAFEVLAPNMITFAENKIERDLNLLPLETSRSYALTAGNNQLQLPVADFVTIRSVMVNGVPLTPVTKEFLQNCYGSAGTLATPLYFAMYGGDATTGGNTYNNIIVGPWPDSNYATVATGTTRSPTLYQNATTPLAATGTTFISTWLPDLLLMASAVYLSAYQRNWGKMADDPAMALSYEAAYQGLLGSARTEELRKRFEASAWSSTPTSVAATPTR